MRTDLAESGTVMSNSLTHELDTFQGVQNSLLRWLLLLLPLFILILVIAILQSIDYDLRNYPGTVMYITGLVTAAFSLFAFQLLMELIPRTLRTLWNRKIIVYSLRKVLNDANMADALNPHNPTLDSAQLEEQYRDYICNFKKWMNHPSQLGMGFIFTLFVFTWEYSLIIEFFTIMEFFIAFIIGLMAWRILITSLKIRELDKKFYIEPKLLHSDGCGGLEPLGNLFLWNILIVTIPVIYLGGWILLGFIFGAGTKYSNLTENYASLFSKLLLVPVAFAFISIQPLWSVHKTMVSWRVGIQQQLDGLSNYISLLDLQLLKQVEKLRLLECERKSKKLELTRELLESNRHIPVWPLKTRNIVTYAASVVTTFFWILNELFSILPIFRT